MNQATDVLSKVLSTNTICFVSATASQYHILFAFLIDQSIRPQLPRCRYLLPSAKYAAAVLRFLFEIKEIIEIVLLAKSKIPPYYFFVLQYEWTV